jgi:hypothetical protein
LAASLEVLEHVLLVIRLMGEGGRVQLQNVGITRRKHRQ